MAARPVLCTSHQARQHRVACQTIFVFSEPGVERTDITRLKMALLLWQERRHCENSRIGDDTRGWAAGSARLDFHRVVMPARYVFNTVPQEDFPSLKAVLSLGVSLMLDRKEAARNLRRTGSHL